MAVLGQPRAHPVHTTQELPSPSASTRAHPWSIHTGHGSLHVDFKANTEAWRSFRGGRPAANSMHRPRGCGEEAHPPTLDHHSLRCHLTPPGTMQDATVPPAGTHPRHSSLLLRSTLCRRARVCVVPALSPLWGRVWRVLGRTCLDSRWLFSSLLASDSTPP